MKHLGLILMSMAALPVWAQQSSGTIGKYELAPDAGVVEELSSVKITFSDLGFWWLADPDCSEVKLTSESGTVYKVVKTEGDMENYCIMFFGQNSEPEAITAPGRYTLSIPEGVFKHVRKPEQFNAPIEAEYIIEAMLPNTLDNYLLTPADDQVVSEISTISVSFPDAVSSGVSLPQNLSVITLESNGVTYVCVSAQEISTGEYSLSLGKEADSEAITFKRPGEYRLTIPKKTFCATGTDEYNNSVITATYTLYNPDFNSMTEYETVPAANTYSDSFEAVKITFPNADFGLDFNVDLSGVKLYFNGVPTDYIAGNMSMSAPYDNISFKFAATQYGEPITFSEPGEYRVSIPAGIIYEGNSSYSNCAIEWSFNIGEEPVNNPFSNYQTIPSEGKPIGELFELRIKFPELETNGIEWPYDISKLTLQRVGDETLYKGNSSALYKGCEVITYFTNMDEEFSNPLHFRTPGEYVVKVPAGTFTDAANLEITNKDIELHFTVDAAYNFTYRLTPDPSKVVSSLSEIKLEPIDVLTSVSLTDSGQHAQLSCGEEIIALGAKTAEGNVIFTAPNTVTPGEWKLAIPAGMLSAETTEGQTITNAEIISADYTVKEPTTYTYHTTPANGAKVPMFTKFAVTVEDNLKRVSIDVGAGIPTLQGNGESYELSSGISDKEILFAIPGGAQLENGEYTVSIPAGYIVTTDRDDLIATLPEITSKFVIERPESSDYTHSMLIYNEGWYGHDMASLTHISASGYAAYNVFEDVNPDKSLGLSGTWASRYADKLYAVSKQSGLNLNGAEGGVLTQMDGASLTYIDQITSLPDNSQAYAFCGVNSEKGYLSTSKGIYPVDLTSMTLDECIKAAKTFDLQHGEMIFYQGRLFACVEDWDPIVIDCETDTYIELPTGSVFTGFVTPDGSLYFAKNEEGREFIKVDPNSLSYTPVSLNGGEYTGRMRLANVWSTWRPAPLAVDLKENVVYYATEFDATTVARANLDTGEFIPDFIKLPEINGVQQCLYGQGISVDPHTGEIVLNAVEKGYGIHYAENYVYRVDASNGKILDDKTLKLSQYYWFPSMTVYSGYEAPALDFSDVSLQDGDVTLNMLEHTSLALGNKYMVEYTVSSSAPTVCAVRRNNAYEFQLMRKSEGNATITVKAQFLGLLSSAEFNVGTSAIGDVTTLSDKVDVYTTTGILVLKDADTHSIRQLPAGIYISGGKKIIVR